jgi:hypothetical protein
VRLISLAAILKSVALTQHPYPFHGYHVPSSIQQLVLVLGTTHISVIHLCLSDMCMIAANEVHAFILLCMYVPSIFTVLSVKFKINTGISLK